ncbi:carboxypeptidase regulatory-like domain-containing protein [Microbacterium sp.]|uniref:carboxypeptidase regulatory-like domain-containing protein n=1 Tax=Microbacterium sp. TaxID=51671 RepID=UPI0039E61E63
MRRSLASDDAGFTLIEVVVAMIVFAIISTGFLFVLTSSLATTRDTRARVVAANLASQQIDLIRAAGDVFAVESDDFTTTLNGDTFRVVVRWNWHTSTGASASCEAGAAVGALEYKQVTVDVSWETARNGTQHVMSDTLFTPTTKINDQSLGTVLVGVTDSAGEPVSGATVSLSPAGVAAVTTDSEGCAYLLKVPVNDYTVSVSKSGYIGVNQLTAPTATVSVVAGSSSRVSFSYDAAATYNITYAGNYTGSKVLPTNLTTTFLSTYGTSAVTDTAATNPKSITRFPFSSGYNILAGGFADTPDVAATSCLAPDPGHWAAGTDAAGASRLAGERPGAVGVAAGASDVASVPMGVVQVTGLPSSAKKYVTAVYVGGGAGDPGCTLTTAPKYTFGELAKTTTSTTIALPYGTYKLYYGTSSGATTTQLTSGITAAASAIVSGTGTNTVVVLDPRVAG